MINLLELHGTAILNADGPVETTAQKIGKHLGIEFFRDEHGMYEDLNALIAKWFTGSLALYRIFDQNNRQTSEIAADFHIHSSPTTLGLDYKQCQDHLFYISEFLANILVAETGLQFVSWRYSQESLSIPPIVIPKLMAKLQLETHDSLEQVRRNLSKPLGARFSSLVHDTEESFNEGLSSDKSILNSCMAKALGHLVTLRAKSVPFLKSKPNNINLTVAPNFNPSIVADNFLPDAIVEIDISDYLAAYIKRWAGYSFLPIFSSTA